MRTIAIVNQKGGCGKTTTAINLAAIYARRGLRTLLVDMDPQSHCAAGLGVPESRIEYSIGDALVADLDAGFKADTLRWEVTRNLDLAPSTMRLAAMEAPGGGLHELPDKDRRLEKLLRTVADRYDMCLIDCAPTIGLLTFNALRAARETLIPVETGYFSLNGAHKQWTTIQRMIERIGRPIACHMLATMFDPGSEVGKNILGALRRRFAGQLLPVVIRLHETIREAACLGQPVVDYAPNSEAQKDFLELADWLESHANAPVLQGDSMRHEALHLRTLPFQDRLAAGAHASIGPTAGRAAGPASDRAQELVHRVQGLSRRPGLSGPPTSPSAPADAPVELAPLSALPRQSSGILHSPVMPREQAAPAAAAAQVSPVGGATATAPATPAIPAAPGARPGVVEIDLPATRWRSPDPRYLIRPATPIGRLLPPAERRSAADMRLRDVLPSAPPQRPIVEAPFGVKRTPRGILFTQPATCGHEVFIAGDFNGWSPRLTPLMRREDSGVFQTLVEVPPGKYQYRLVIDGKWQADRYNALTQVNRYGEPNSVLVVPEAQRSA